MVGVKDKQRRFAKVVCWALAASSKSVLMLCKSGGKGYPGEMLLQLGQCLHWPVNSMVRGSLERELHQSVNSAQIRNIHFEGSCQPKLRK